MKTNADSGDDDGDVNGNVNDFVQDPGVRRTWKAVGSTNDERVDLSVPFREKDEAKALGARWDPVSRTWYAPPGIDLANMGRWLPAGVLGDVDPLPGADKGLTLTAFLGKVKSAIASAIPGQEWIRAEISEQREKNGTLFLSLVERTGDGQLLSSARAIIWSENAAAIQEKFARATGGDLRPDIKILLLARAGFHVQYGFSLVIEDIDPSFTLGDMEARLREIRKRLKAEGLYDKNRGLAPPRDYVRVVVISPEKAAGLGDFRREADLLQQAGLCRFSYHQAVFQGEKAAASVATAVRAAWQEHRQRPCDALVLIRGGGAVTDLAWLNDLELARTLCDSPLPVHTGIGHERDSTILDEVAGRRFDTPSKVAAHIKSTILDNARDAQRDMDAIIHHVRRLLAAQEQALDLGRGQVRDGLRRQLAQAEESCRRRRVEIRTSAGLLADMSARSVEHRLERITHQLRENLKSAAEQIESFARQIVGLGPAATLKRGFVLVRDVDGNPVTRKREAVRHAELNIQFHDDHLRVGNLEHDPEES